ncbi:cytochrome P450 [Streptomyces sp. NBC_00083]|uniref:cytochrome P450 n=1 Tax=Streptomyces sp. NBC_00083 TaxID=2975647 RepID=UPI0022507592|nr:cytochrome P450 [Streptomyces sp. NBC_00083]MCX5384778.1 cytochrome P450 [Streptomyces sp. NBC_00083]
MTDVRDRELPRFSLDDAALLRDPYPVYRRLRAAGPLCRGGPAQWVVTRYDEVSRLLKDRRLGRAFPVEFQEMSVGAGPAVDFLRGIVIDRDPPDHTRLRRLLTKALPPTTVRTLSGLIGDLVDELLTAAEERGSFDAVTDLAQPLPVLVMSTLLGIPHSDRAEVMRRSLDVAKAFAVFIPEEERAAAHDGVRWLRGYLRGLLRERLAHPGDDLLSAIALARDDEHRPLTEEETVDNALFLYYAGFETTTNLIATGCHALIHHPDEQRRLRADRALMPTALEEFLRWDAPIHTTTRLTLEPVEVGGRTIRPNRVVVLLLASANFDERQFADPERLDLARRPNAHLSFGGGAHHCLGAMLARVEGSAVFGRLLDRPGLLEPAGEADWQPSAAGFRFPFCAYRSIPVARTI